MTDPKTMSPAGIHRVFAGSTHYFPEWEEGSRAKSDFMAGELVDILVALGAALIALDKHLSAGESMLKRVRSWYEWLKNRSEKPVEPPSSSRRERMLLVLFDAYLATRKPTSVERLRIQSGLTDEECTAALAELKQMGLARESPNGWMFKRS